MKFGKKKRLEIFNWKLPYQMSCVAFLMAYSVYICTRRYSHKKRLWQIGGTGLSFKVLKLSRARTIYPITTKLGTLLGFMKIQIMYKNIYIANVVKLSVKEKP